MEIAGPTSLEIQNFLEENWREHKKTLNQAGSFKIQLRLNLYTKIQPDQIFSEQSIQEDLKQDLNKLEKNLYFFKSYLNPLQILFLQGLILESKIALNFQKALYYRKIHQFKLALLEIEQSSKLIHEYEQIENTTLLKGITPTHELHCLFHYHKGKIQRMLAGYDLTHLDQDRLQNCEQSYLQALSYQPHHPFIHSSLGYLYNDMQRHEEALRHHECANQLHPNFPDLIHGMAYGLMNLTFKEADENYSIDENRLKQSEEAFLQAIELFKEFQSENARVYLDYGKLKLFKNQTKEALELFNQGLAIDPHHGLLLLERGLLLGQLKQYEQALKDLKLGCILQRERGSLYQKYHQAITSCQESIPIRLKSKSAFKDCLKECGEYARLNKEKLFRPLTCFISYSWGIPEQEKWVEELAEDLEKAGFNVLLDHWHTRKGYQTMDFVEKILSDEVDYILVVGTPRYLEKFRHNSSHFQQRDFVVKIEAKLINYLIGYNSFQCNKVIPLLLEGTKENSLPPLLHPKNMVDFTKECYEKALLELIRDLYQINQKDSYFKTLINKYLSEDSERAIKI